MNKRKTFILGMMILLVLILFPYSTKKVLAGNGEVQTRDNEKIGDCILSIEICELRSLFLCYKKQFSYTLDGTKHNTFESSVYDDADNLNLIFQMYYEKVFDRMNICSLEYPDDFSYAVITTDTNRYYLHMAS
jgi:hypothetical protein